VTYPDRRKMQIARPTAVLAALATGAALALAGGAGTVAASTKPVHKSVKVSDDVFSPKKLTVPVNSTITWKWSSANSDTHDVYLSKRPKGVKRFHSDPASSDFSYKRKLAKKGTYTVLCTFHENMTQKITVR
jgi:plastocyanin